MKYILYIDYCGNQKKCYEYRTMKAKNFQEAIEEADKIHNPKTMYLIRILEKTGKVVTEGEWKTQLYTAIECKRSVGWHRNNVENCEINHCVKRFYMKLDGEIADWYKLQ